MKRTVLAIPFFGLLTTSTLAQTVPEADREAILAMLGDYQVSFRFDETVVLQPGYERAEPQLSGALETVILVADEGDHIVLQHILVSPAGHVTKHWRQDWRYEASERFEFSDDQTWTMTALPTALTRGAWTQCVYEVSDAPRYCGTGRWNHRYGQATWTSDRSWRPLPRREHTRRDDYNALNVQNRHTITPQGWTHEQDNSKTLRDSDGNSIVLVREHGFNDYRRTSAVDFAPAHAYWEQTRDYWALVREHWDAALASGQLVLNTPVDGFPLISELFALAEEPADPRNGISALFDSYVLQGGSDD